MLLLKGAVDLPTNVGAFFVHVACESSVKIDPKEALKNHEFHNYCKKKPDFTPLRGLDMRNVTAAWCSLAISLCGKSG